MPSQNTSQRMQHLPVDIGHEFSKLEIDHPRTVLAFAAILHQR